MPPRSQGGGIRFVLLDREVEPAAAADQDADTRSTGWIGGSVEVDAIPAPTLRSIVEEWIAEYVDEHEIAVLESAEEAEREILRSFLRGTGHDDNEVVGR